MTELVHASPQSDFDPTVPETFDSAHDEYARLRAQCPVAHSDAYGGFWALMGYEDVRRAASDWQTFITSRQNVVPKVAFTGRRPPLHFDPPEHTPYRAALNPLLSQARAEELAPTARAFAASLLEPMVAKGGGDICTEFSTYLPVQVFGSWMKVPEDWWDTLHKAAHAFVGAVRAYDSELMKATSIRLYDIARDLIVLRKHDPGDPANDPTTALLAARTRDGEPLPDEMIVGTVRQVLAVGMIAPMVTIGNICVHLSRDRDLQSKLRAEPELLPAAIEEFLRLYTPYRGFARTAVCDVEMGGRTIAAEAPIALVYSSANRDDSVFPDGSKFQLHRPNIGDHLAFGRGPHNCPGIHLARMELRVAMEELLERTQGFAVSGEIQMADFPEIGAISVPLRFDPPA